MRFGEKSKTAGFCSVLAGLWGESAGFGGVLAGLRHESAGFLTISA
ncbi:hypothetical protein [Rossellomorea sp. LjRoot5]